MPSDALELSFGRWLSDARYRTCAVLSEVTFCRFVSGRLVLHMFVPSCMLIAITMCALLLCSASLQVALQGLIQLYKIRVFFLFFKHIFKAGMQMHWRDSSVAILGKSRAFATPALCSILVAQTRCSQTCMYACSTILAHCVCAGMEANTDQVCSRCCCQRSKHSCVDLKESSW